MTEMVPTGIATVVSFVFFIVPGLLWELLVERRKPTKNESAFREASRVALVSTPFSVLATAAVLSISDRIHAAWLAEAGTWVQIGSPTSAGAILVAAVMGVGELVVATAFVAVAWLQFADQLYGTRSVRAESAWTYAFGDPPHDSIVLATVRTTDGREYRGQLLSFTAETEWADREITLAAPLTVLVPGSGATPMFDQLIVFPASNISSVSGLYSSPSALESSKVSPASERKRLRVRE